MTEAFIIRGSLKKIAISEFFERLCPIHKGCGGEIICGIDASDWKLKVSCPKCGKKVPITDAEQRQMVAAILGGRRRKINDQIVVISKKGA